jgi:8-oxo-dGTP pyrophosphatase MutT (NUDIX family)
MSVKYNINRLTQTTDVLRVRTAATGICVRREGSRAAAVQLTKEECAGPAGVPKLHSVAPHLNVFRSGALIIFALTEFCAVVTAGQAAYSSEQVAALDTGAASSTDDLRTPTLFGDEDSVEFSSGWELLMQQREVKNMLRSTREEVALMRYPGEYSFPGGGIDTGETAEDATRRELSEELRIPVPSDAKLRLLSVKQTRPINNTSNIMYNYLCAAEENPWLASFDVEAANAALARQRSRCDELVASGEFWKLSAEEKAAVSPEVRELVWLDVREVVRCAFTSMNTVFTPLNAFQAQSFAQYGREMRDPMFLTMMIALELETFPSFQSLKRHTDSLDR